MLLLNKIGNVKVIYNSYITRLLHLDGLVLYPFVLLSTSSDETLPSVLKHEVTHVHQIERDGFCNFYFQYFIHMCAGSYANNIYEREAFSNENTALTRSEIKLLNLPPTFPKTDRAMSILKHSLN
jgi:hypothetical protein